MKDDNFFTIYGWMVNSLELSKSELLVFAFIYAFDAGCSCSLQYISDSIKASKKTTQSALDSLEKKSLIKKEKRAGKTSVYTVVKTTTHRGKNYHTTVVKTTTNNNKHNNSNKKYNAPSSFNDFDQRVYNFTELEKILRSN